MIGARNVGVARAIRISHVLLGGLFALVAIPSFGATGPQALAADITASIDPSQQHATIEKLVGFGTRHTASDIRSDTRGIGAARRWVASRFEAIANDCGHCLRIATPAETVTGERFTQPVEVVDVLAIQPGTTDPTRVVMITGHLDSRVTDVMNATADAPGANDDGSGVAAVLEAARVLSRHRFAATIVYGVLSGEEQGLYGGTVLAHYASANGWHVEADLNNDIIGNTDGGDGVHDNTSVRVFSEGMPAAESAELAKLRIFEGGENDSPSRNLSRYMERMAQEHMTNFTVKPIWRRDRFGRGGDQLPMQQAGFTAVRLTEAHENYTRQHQDLRTEGAVHYGDTLDGIDFNYLAQVTRLNALTLAFLASAPDAPAHVRVSGAVSPDTTIEWQPSPAASRYSVWRRATNAANWQQHITVPDGASSRLLIHNVTVDDSLFGISAESDNGFESPVSFPSERAH